MLKLIVLSPLFAALLLGLIGKKLSERIISLIACSSIAISTIAAFFTFFSKLLPAQAGEDSIRRVSENLGTWIQVGNFTADFGLVLDPLSGIMLLFVTGVGFLIHVFATGYMHGDKSFHRFFCYLNLFMFAMLTLILADNFLLMFVGWEGVGVCSYLLIGYYFLKQEAGDAAKKAFIANRIGDFGVVLGIMLIFFKCGSINFEKVMAWAASQPIEVLGAKALMAGGVTTIAVLLFIGATGKSAQIPLFVWLPDAMAGPTPVSALIHAATMVTAGVYMVVRCNAIFIKAPTALLIVAIIGGATALIAATIGLGQWDIKKVLAYSTVSQLGYMFLACGAGAFTAAIFHVMTHAFFKALLFLGSGSVIHGMHHEQDMKYMGGLKKYMPYTRWTMFAGWLAISGFPFLSGFFSKDEILWKTFSSSVLPGPAGKILWGIGALTAFLTAIYMTRLMVMTFEGKERMGDKVHDDHSDSHTHDHPRESPWVMVAPLVVLAVLAVVGGFIGVPESLGGHNYFEHFLEPVVSVHSGIESITHEVPMAEVSSEHGNGLELGLTGLSVVIALAGMGTGWVWFSKNPLWNPPILLQGKYFIDEIYGRLILAPISFLSREVLWKIFDVKIIDAFINDLGQSVFDLGSKLKLLQSGFIRAYAACILVSVVLLIGYFFVGRPW